MSASLSRDNTGRLKTLGALLGADGRVGAGEVQAALFPSVSPATANKALERLIKAVNDKARGRGATLLLRIDPDKKLGGERQLWFEGEIETPDARLEATSSIPVRGMVEDARGVNLVDTSNAVVLLTFNELELAAVRRRFGDLGSPLQLTDEVAFLGELAGVQVVHAHSLAGQGQVNAANLTGRVIDKYDPIAVVGVGIAMGLKDGQRIGDVLVSREVHDTEMVRINADGSVTARGRYLSANAAWVKRFEALHLEENRTLAASRCVLVG